MNLRHSFYITKREANQLCRALEVRRTRLSGVAQCDQTGSSRRFYRQSVRGTCAVTLGVGDISVSMIEARALVIQQQV